MTDLFHEYGLPAPDEAIEEGCVSRWPLGWSHSAVVIARDECKRKLGRASFDRGAPRYRGGEPSNFKAFKRERS